MPAAQADQTRINERLQAPATSFVDKELAIINQSSDELDAKLIAANPFLKKSLEQIADRMTIDGYKSKSSVDCFIGGNFRVEITFKPEAGQAIPALEDIDKLTTAGFNKQNAEIENLKKSGWIFGVSVSPTFDPTDGKITMVLKLDSGPRSADPSYVNEIIGSPVSAGVRKQMWQSVIANLARHAAMGSTASDSPLINLTNQNLMKLRTYYETIEDRPSASLVQSLIVGLTPTVTAIRDYAESGKVKPETVEKLPKNLQSIVNYVNDLTANVPDAEYLKRIESANQDTKLSKYLTMMLRLEYLTETYDRRTVDIATLELKEAVRFAKEKSEGKPISPERAGEIVREYFESYSKSEYTFNDNTNGIAGGVVIRRTDCSTRTITGHEMFTAMGFSPGVEQIMVSENGRPNFDQQAHVYNFIKKADGSKIFFDFGKKSNEPYAFSSNAPIIEHYRGTGSKVPVLVDVLEGDDKIFGAFINEPIAKEVKRMIKLFQKEKLDLPELLVKHPEEIKTVRNIISFLRVQDRLAKTGTYAMWERGLRDEILKSYN